MKGAIAWSEDSLHCYNGGHIVAIYMATDNVNAERHTISSLKADLASGKPQASDEAYAAEEKAKHEAYFNEQR